MDQKELLDKIPKMQQRQDSETEQLNDLVFVAVKLGMYDAADWIKRNFWEIKRN